jgi:hypothetical protein
VSKADIENDQVVKQQLEQNFDDMDDDLANEDQDFSLTVRDHHTPSSIQLL